MTQIHSASTADVEDVAQHVVAAQRVVYVCGAGVSVASGIAPYRRAPGALWSRFHLDWGTRQRFEQDTLRWWKEFWAPTRQNIAVDRHPNAAHHALVRLMRAGPEHLVVTQNIDGLHVAAGHPAAQLVEIHGRKGLYRCVDGDCVHFSTQLLTGFDHQVLERGEVPRCPACTSLIRPLVLLFDEHYQSHPALEAVRAMRALNDCDLLVFAGTSHAVGITAMASESAKARGIPVFNLNVEARPGMVNVVGACEQSLPALAEKVVPD